MRLIYKQFSVFAGFAALLALLVVNTIVTRRQLSIQDNKQAWVEHTQQVLLELGAVESLLKDAETGQRGFLYTEEPRYLEPYNTAVAQLDAHMNQLQQLIADNRQQQPHMPMLIQLVKQKRDELDQTIKLVQAGQPEQARTLVLSDQGELTMQNIRNTMQEMREAEKSVL